MITWCGWVNSSSQFCTKMIQCFTPVLVTFCGAVFQISCYEYSMSWKHLDVQGPHSWVLDQVSSWFRRTTWFKSPSCYWNMLARWCASSSRWFFESFHELSRKEQKKKKIPIFPLTKKSKTLKSLGKVQILVVFVVPPGGAGATGRTDGTCCWRLSKLTEL